jgi:hypothetical protein
MLLNFAHEDDVIVLEDYQFLFVIFVKVYPTDFFVVLFIKVSLSVQYTDFFEYIFNEAFFYEAYY